MEASLIGKEPYMVEAIRDQFRQYVTDIAFVGYSEEDDLAVFEGTNILPEVPVSCTLKTDGKSLWIHMEDTWAYVGDYTLTSYIPADVESPFMDHYEAYSLIDSYDFTRDEMLYLLGVVYAKRTLTKDELQKELDAAKDIFALAAEQTGD